MNEGGTCRRGTAASQPAERTSDYASGRLYEQTRSGIFLALDTDSLQTRTMTCMSLWWSQWRNPSLSVTTTRVICLWNFTTFKKGWNNYNLTIFYSASNIFV